jgi:hypothetical protein
MTHANLKGTRGETRREMLQKTAALSAAAIFGAANSATAQTPDTNNSKTSLQKVPLIDITDLYHPPQDPGDNIDLISAYALPEVELKAVILDVTQRYRRPYRDPANPTFEDPLGGRDPGFIPVTQLNYIFNRNVPCAVGPFESMRSPEDQMLDAPGFQQSGVELILKILRESDQPVDIASFGSARPLAVAFNRAPDLMREKTRLVHLCAGASPAKGFIEWNVQLDVHAFRRMLSCNLPVAIYPCGGDKTAFDLAVNNSYWKLPAMEFVHVMPQRLQSYLSFAVERSSRMDFLCAVEDPISSEALGKLCKREHHIWETAVWAEIARRRLVKRADGLHRLVPIDAIANDDAPLDCGIKPVVINVKNDGQFDFSYTDKPTNFQIFYREDPEEYQRALCDAFPALYASYKA